MENTTLSSLVMELRRGTLILSVLSQLSTPRYGYALVQSLEEKGFPIDSNTLYPLLRRLDKQGLLVSEWDMSDSKPRKYYKRTELGDQIYVELKKTWERMNLSMESLLKEG